MYTRKADLVVNSDNAAKSHATLHMMLASNTKNDKPRKTISLPSLLHADSDFHKSGFFSVHLPWHPLGSIAPKKWLPPNQNCGRALRARSNHGQSGVAWFHVLRKRSAVSPHKTCSGMLPPLDDTTVHFPSLHLTENACGSTSIGKMKSQNITFRSFCNQKMRARVPRTLSLAPSSIRSCDNP